MALILFKPSFRSSTSVLVWLNIKAMTGCILIEVIILSMCLHEALITISNMH